VNNDHLLLAARVASGAPYPDPVPKSRLLLEALLKQRRPESEGARGDAAFARAVSAIDKLLGHEESPAALLEVDDSAAGLFADELIRALIYRLVAANEFFKEDHGISGFDIGVELDRFDRAYDLVKQFQRTARGYASRPFDAILCDIDGVLRRWPSIEPIERAHGVAPGTLFGAAFAPHRLLPAITGQVTDAQWRASVIEDLADSGELTAETARALVAAWSAMRAVPDENVVALLELAREVVPVALVSNATDRLEADLIDAGLSGFVDNLVNTSRIGFAKPDPRVYAYAAEQVGVPVRRCLFVDDTVGHVEAARAAGMQALHFREAADLDNALRPLFQS
jgi:putative hydrolase of the HAD superfamily